MGSTGRRAASVAAKLGAALRVALKDPAFIQQEVGRGGNEILSALAAAGEAELARA